MPAADPAAFAPGRRPVFIRTFGDTPEEGFYGFPTLPGAEGMKVGMKQHAALAADPDHLRRDVSPVEAVALHRDHLARRLAGLLPQGLRGIVCPYTMTPDGDVLVARAPDNDRVLLVSACSGHGFNHLARLGEAAAGAALPGLDGFAAGRLALAPAL